MWRFRPEKIATVLGGTLMIFLLTIAIRAAMTIRINTTPIVTPRNSTLPLNSLRLGRGDLAMIHLLNQQDGAR